MINKFAYVTGGADRYALTLTRALRSRGHEVRWLSTASPSNTETNGWYVPASVTHDTRTTLSLRRRIRAGGLALWNPRAYAATREAIEAFNPDVVHVHKLYPQLSAAPITAAFRAGVPIVQTIHDFEFLSANPLDHEARAIDRLEAKLAYRFLNTTLFVVRKFLHARRITEWMVPSRSLAALYRQKSRIRPRFVPQFIDEPDIPNYDFERRSGIGFAGRLSKEKGVAQLAEAAKLLPAEEFLVAGSGPEAEILSLPNVQSIGWVESVSAFFAGRCVAVMPSTCHENAPIVMFEAMLAGTPLVVYDMGGLREYVEDAGAGLVVAPNPEALVAGIEHLIADRAKWDELSASAYAAARERYTVDKALPIIEDEYLRAKSSVSSPVDEKQGLLAP